MANPEIEREIPKPAGKRGELIAIVGAKGGVGRTVLAVNLAVALSKNNHLQIGIMDGDFQFGNVGLAMDLHPTFTIKDVVDAYDTVDSATLPSYLIHHNSGVKVLAAPDRPEYAELIKPAIIDQLCDMLLQHYDFVIADTGPGLHEQTLALIEKADQIFALTTLEMAAIKNTKLLLETLDLLGLGSKVQVVVNRATMESVIKATDVPDILGLEIPMYIPNDFQVVAQSLNIGIPFVVNHGKTDVSKAVFKMAEQLISRREITLFKPKQPSIFQSLLHKAKDKASLF